MHLQPDRERRSMEWPEAHAVDQRLATLRCAFSNRLPNAGHRDEARATIRRAVDVRLALVDSHVDMAHMARTLNIVAVRLAQAGRLDDSLAACEQAVRVYRRLAAAKPTAYEPSLAPVLNTLSVRLAKVGRRADALAASKQVLDIYRRLATSDPAQFDPHLWTSLSNHADRLAESGHGADATRIRAEVSARRGLHQRRLAEANPGARRTLNQTGAEVSMPVV